MKRIKFAIIILTLSFFSLLTLKSLKKALNAEEESGEEEEGGLLKVKEKSKEQKEREEAEYIEWFKGQKSEMKDEGLRRNMEPLREYWADPDLPEGERFLRDYILNRAYIDKGEESGSGSAAEDGGEEKRSGKEKRSGEEKRLDLGDFSDEERIIGDQEEFERKYNFRFEDPDPEFIKVRLQFGLSENEILAYERIQGCSSLSIAVIYNPATKRKT